MKNAHNRFLKAVKNLSGLYDFSMHCYAHMANSLQEQLAAGELAPESHFRSSYGFLPHHRVANTLGNAKDNYPRQLRSVMLVRLVSEFEAFLIDHVREVSLVARLSFRDDARIEWTRAKLLAFRSIDAIKEHFRELDGRSMSSGGFNEIRRYYKKYLEIEICPPNVKLEELREVQARRHLHVHNLGIVDEKYTHEFHSSVGIGVRLEVSDDYLKNAIALFRLTARHVATATGSKFPPARKTRLLGGAAGIRDGRILYFTKACFRDEDALARYFELERDLDPHGLTMKAVLVGGERIGMVCEWTIVGNKESLKGYFVDLKRQQNRGLVQIIEQRRLSPKAGRTARLESRDNQDQHESTEISVAVTSAATNARPDLDNPE